jgi:hypothetical protein
MWLEVKKAPNRMMADMWKDFLEGEGIPALILPEGELTAAPGERASFRIFVSQEKEHVVREVMRRI